MNSECGEILIFKWFLLLKIQINSQKTRFWKEKSVEDVVVTRGPTAQATLVYLWRKVVCFVVMRSTETRCFRSCSWCLWKVFDEEVFLVSLESFGRGGVLGVFGKLLTRKGAWAWFHDIWTRSAKVLEYWIISSLKIKLNRSWNFWRNRNVPLMLLERSSWAGFNGIYLVRFWFRMWEILIFKWFLLLKIQINSKKPGFGRKNQFRTW